MATTETNHARGWSRAPTRPVTAATAPGITPNGTQGRPEPRSAHRVPS